MIIPILGSKSVSLPPFGNFMFRFLFCIQAVMFYPNSTKRKRENKITISIWCTCIKRLCIDILAHTFFHELTWD